MTAPVVGANVNVPFELLTELTAPPPPPPPPLPRSQLSRFCATMSVKATLRSRALTPRFSGNCDKRRGRLAPVICTWPVCGLVKVRIALVIGSAMEPIGTEVLDKNQPNAGSVDR